MRGSRARASPTTRPLPCTTLNTPAGRPASCSARARCVAESGVSSAGLITTALPLIRAGADLPGRNGDGEVPRRDEPDDAERFAPGGDGGVRQAAGQHFAGGGPAEGAEEAQHVRGALDLALGLGEGLAFFPDQVFGDGGLAFDQQVAGGDEDGAAGRCGHGCPGRLGCGGGGDGGVHVRGGAAGGEGRELARAGRVHPLGVRLAQPFAVDEVPGGDEFAVGGG